MDEPGGTNGRGGTAMGVGRPTDRSRTLEACEERNAGVLPSGGCGRCALNENSGHSDTS